MYFMHLVYELLGQLVHWLGQTYLYRGLVTYLDISLSFCQLIFSINTEHWLCKIQLSVCASIIFSFLLYFRKLILNSFATVGRNCPWQFIVGQFVSEPRLTKKQEEGELDIIHIKCLLLSHTYIHHQNSKFDGAQLLNQLLLLIV